MLKKKLAFLLSVMLVFSLAGYVVCTMAGSKQIEKSERETLVVSSFYPMYILTKNLLLETETIGVSNLTENQIGCLHDYQLTAGDMKLLLSLIDEERAVTQDLLVLSEQSPLIGYETSNHYFYTERNLIEKLLQMDQMYQRIVEDLR